METSDGSEDVNDFLRRVRELSEQRDREDAERTRKLEDEIMEGRKQREARRAERARSLSPEKQSPSVTPLSIRSTRNTPNLEHTLSPSLPMPKETISTILPEPRSENVQSLNPAKQESSEAANENTVKDRSFTNGRSSPSKALAGSASSLARSGTLSWQQRPTGSRGGVRTRPISIAGEHSLTAQPHTDDIKPSIEVDQEPSRDQIAQNLASKDPAWFRQSANRAIGSAANRKGQDDQESRSTYILPKQELHGLPGKTPLGSIDANEKASPLIQNDLPPLKKELPKKPVLDEMRPSSRSFSPGSIDVNKPPITVQPTHMFPPPAPSDRSFNDNEREESASLAMSRSQSRLDSDRVERPVSPTKGMGGFVQSAMMRRTDSVSKRWSATASPALARRKSNADARNAYGIANSSGLSKSGSPQASVSRESSTEPISRPTSSRSNTASTTVVSAGEKSGGESRDTPRFGHSRSKSSMSIEDKGNEFATASSPSKRWSPTKSSWLESALTKPESPKSKITTKPPSQPSWLVDLNKSRQQSKDLTQAPISAPPVDQPRKEEDVDPKVLNSRSKSPGLEFVPKIPATKPKPKPARLSEELKNSTADDLQTKHNSTTTTAQNSLMDSSKAAQLNDPSLKRSKPETPPKKDFRASLKPRSDSMKQKEEENLEFRSVFGKLKRTQTEKYVAPDELKDNILRGKAGLALSNGPSKSPRKDDFKESLLKQKETIKAKEIPSVVPKPVQTTPVPEAIAKKRALARSNSSGNILGPAEDKAVITSQIEESVPSDLTKSLRKTTTAPEVRSLQTETIGGRLADRFNPGLAGILARGRPAVGNDGSPSPIDIRPAESSGSRNNDLQESSSTEPLQHMTKNRARGPKRRAPKTSAPNLDTAEEETSSNIKKSPRLPSKPKPVSPNVSRNVTPSKSPIMTRSPSISKEPKPPIAPKSARLVSGSKSHLSSGSLADSSMNASSTAKQSLADKDASPANSSKPAIQEQAQRLARVPQSDKTESLPSVKSATSRWGQSSQTPSTLAKQPIKLPTQKDEQAAMENAGLLRSAQLDGTPSNRGLGLQQAERQVTQPQSRTTHVDMHSQPPVIPAKKDSIKQKSVASSPIPQTSEASRLFAEFFDENPITSQNFSIDTQSILSADRSNTGKIKTLRKQIRELDSDGKPSTMPSNAEHVLFSESMYLCTHVYGDTKGARVTDVYLWIGSAVPESSLEEPQAFARRTSKEVGGVLSLFRQGKEPANFFQALGGIVITRQGSARSSNSRPYVLCGRRHLGHMAFDEVALNPSSFCAGFPYIVVPAQSTKVFLWKGAGCNAEELGCARLISMDIGLSAEVEEVDAESESAGFLHVVGAASSRAIPSSADHWRLKAKAENYKTRLFLVDGGPGPNANRDQSPAAIAAAAMTQAGAALWSRIRQPSTPDRVVKEPIQVHEIAPFCQADLEVESVYVLDAFFEIYVILGPLAQSKAQAFSTALLFAQDYGILAASNEDRPFVPVSTVVMEGAPRDMKSVFRHWDDTQLRTGALMAGRRQMDGDGDLGRKKSLRVLPLSAAIAATKGS